MNTGEACENKCEWFHDSNSSAYTMECLDITGVRGHCTPFTRKQNQLNLFQVKLSAITKVI